MTVAERLGHDLAAARRAGLAFEDAWPVAVQRAVTGQRADERTAWHAALADTRPTWLGAWERRPATVPERALLAVAQDPEREAMPEHGTCGRRGPPIRERIAA